MSIIYNKVDLEFSKQPYSATKFRQECCKFLPLIKTISINDVELNKKNETVFIDFRWFPHIEYLVRNVIIKLPNWSHTIVCGNNNYNKIRDMVYSINRNIRIIQLNINTCTIQQYSNLLLTTNFWNMFNGDKILIYQEDTFLFHGNIDKFLEYDYVGSPWPTNFFLDVGNGGFSLRDKKVMIKCILEAKHYISNNLEKEEDIFFSKYIKELKIGKIPTRKIALEFGEELCKGKNPLGGHKFYVNHNSLIPSYRSFLLLDNNVNLHSIIEYGKYNNLFNINATDNYMLIFNINNYFVHNKCNIAWIGIVDSKINMKLYLLKEAFFYCEKLIVFNKDYVDDKLDEWINIEYRQLPSNYIDIKKLYSDLLREINIK